MNNSTEIWQKFADYPGSKQIASETAVNGLMELIQKRQPKTILEIGSGIGTLTYAILSASREAGTLDQEGFDFYTVENNSFCLERLNENLDDFKGQYHLLNKVKEIRGKDLQFDLIIVDGFADSSHGMDEMEFGGLLAQGGVIFVEGTRLIQRKQIRDWYGNRKFLHQQVLVFRRFTVIEKKDRTAYDKRSKHYHVFYFEPQLSDVIDVNAQRIWNFVSTRLQRLLQSESRLPKQNTVGGKCR